MSHIQVLPESLSNLIAAGEVVERPASVVKELVENAIDAGATQIEIEIQHAGQTLIKITDNGHGMNEEDARLAFIRHATSKVRQKEDLRHIMTMGFRGEALPSIAAVSKVTLSTCLQNSTLGVELSVHGGREVTAKAVGRASGTTIIVRDLFYNTPARKKFLKSAATEQGHITQLVEHMAIVHLALGFSYKVDHRVVLQCTPASDLRERLAAIYHKALPEPLYQVEQEAGGVWVKGLVAGPQVVRPTRQNIKLFVNQRPIEHRSLTHAVVQAYRTLIPEGKFPTAFLLITMPPELVDVNVHPAKREVKFQDESAMHQVVYRAVKNALQQLQTISANPQPQGDKTGLTGSGQDEDYQRQSLNLNWSGSRIKESVATYYRQAAPAGRTPQYFPRENTMQQEPGVRVPPTGENKSSPSSGLRILGQVGSMFIAGEDEEGFFLVDQHAAHERLIYEALKKKGPEGTARQPLLLPITFESTPSDQPRLMALLEYFAHLGVEISPLGGTTFTIQSQPALLENPDLKGLIQDVLDYSAAFSTLPEQAALEDKILISMACHSAIKAGERLPLETMTNLILDMKTMPHLPTCPHGRPTMFRLTWGDLEKLFKRDYR